MAAPRLYDQKGNSYVKGFSYYQDFDGKLVRVPSMFGPKESIMRYLHACFDSGVGNVSREQESQIVGYLEEFWREGEQKTAKILTMLDQRAEKLKEMGSIRHLLYISTKDRLSRLTIPIFNKEQISNIPNVPSFIIDEIDQILKEPI